MTNDISGFIDLFQADKPEGNRPHFKGFIKLNGQKLEFACWPAKSGKPGVYSGKVTPPREPQGQQQGGGYQRPAAPPPQTGGWDDDSSIPF